MADTLTTIAAEDAPKCLVQTVADVMRREPALEAVKIDRAQHTISLATLGPPNPDLERVVTQEIRALQTHTPSCRLLEGDANCNTCALTIDPLVQRHLTIRQDNASTTIARVTCPRSEEHTSELQSHVNLVCRLLLEKKKRLCRGPRPRAAGPPV